MSVQIKKKYMQSFKDSYSKEFPFILKSRKGENYAFCSACGVDVNIGHGGKRDITNHIGRKKHSENVSAKSSNSMESFLTTVDNSVAKAECLFTAFLVEHNLPISCADHVGPLLRRMFPKCEIAKDYKCARTKTTKIIKEMASYHSGTLIDNLKKHPFCIATDGSNNSDKKLYPIVVTYFREETSQIESSLLSAPLLNGDSTGNNIGNLLLENLEKYKIPILNCIGFGSDNAPVMIGRKNGAAAILKNKQEHLIVIGCPCHLLNLAAEKGSAALPLNVDELLVDIFYFLEKSSKRKDKLKLFQELHNVDNQKMLKHVCTRWLSTGKCLNRLLLQWEPLISFFNDEIKMSNKKSPGSLEFYTIPKKASEPKKKFKTTSEVSAKRSSSKANFSESKVKSFKLEDTKKNKNNILSREERLFYILSADINKAYCQFLQITLLSFENININLQSQSPLINQLRTMLLEFYGEILSKFVKPSIIKLSGKDYLKVDFHLPQNQKEDCDLVVGSSTNSTVQSLSLSEKTEFFDNVRKFFIVACDYMLLKFPFKDEVLMHAEVCSLKSFENASFSSVLFFLEKFPVLLYGENKNIMIDNLQKEFCRLQIHEIGQSVLNEKRVDTQWYLISQMKDESNTFLYANIARFMLSILTLPHSNAECERIFSQVNKLRTEFRSSMSDESLENLLITKTMQKGKCFEQKYDDIFLKKIKHEKKFL